MRQYNADPSHSVKVRFYGFDSPTAMVNTDSPRQLLHFTLDYLASIDNASSQAWRARIDPLLGEDAAWENPAAMMDPTQSIGLSPAATALRIETEELISELQVRRPELVEKSDFERFTEALHYLALARQLLTYHAGLARNSSNRTADLLGLRDAMMADNLVYIVARERGRGKVLVFAHNNHLMRGQTQWQLGPNLLTWWPVGAQLQTIFGPRYVAMASAVGVSDDNGIGQPEAGTLEALLTAAPGPVRLIPTHRGQGLSASVIDGLPTRSGSEKNYSYFPLTPQSLANFDWLILLDSVTYHRGGIPLP
jgi:erythromycin esterase-like protein